MYTIKGKTKEIKATSRVAIKIKDNFYTLEATETKDIPMEDGIDIKQEWNVLFNDLNAVIDGQVADLLEATKKK